MRLALKVSLLICGLVFARKLKGGPTMARTTATVKAEGPDDDLVQRLGPQSLRNRTSEIFSSAYITLLSIVQGLSLALLVQQYLAVSRTEVDLFLLVAQTSGAAIGIFVVYYMYVWFVMVARWPPTALDSFIPFGLGALQAFLILQMGKTTMWLIAITILQIGAALAFVHSIWRLVEEMFDFKRTFELVHRLLFFLVLVQVVGAAVTMTSLRTMHAPNADFITGLVTILVTASAIGSIVICDRTLAQVYKSVGLRWIRPLKKDPLPLTSTVHG